MAEQGSDAVTAPEPWLRGILAGFDPVRGHLLRSSEQIREDARRAVTIGKDARRAASIATDAQQAVAIALDLHAQTAFHLKHLAGSTERLCTYAEGGELSAEQLAALGREQETGESADELLRLVDRAFEHYERIVRATRPEEFAEVRYVGRKKLPVTLIGLLIHIAEHGQRHVGQAITSAKAEVAGGGCVDAAC